MQSNSRPIFNPNQTLRSQDLNNLVNYVDSSSDRSLRPFLIGKGIIQGFTVIPNIQKQPIESIAVTQGYGLTSEGYFIRTVKNHTFEYYKDTELKLEEFEVINCKELFTTEQKKEKDLEFINIKNPNQYFVLVLLKPRSTDKMREHCTLNYDVNGEETEFVLHFYLLDETQLDPILKDKLFQKKHEELNDWDNIPDCKLDGLIPSTAIDDQLLYDAIDNMSESFEEIDKLFKHLNPEYQFNQYNLECQHLKNIINSSNPSRKWDLQYFYNYLVDLITAYQELKEALFDVKDYYVFRDSQFPKYLLLGKVEKENKSEYLYYHPFIQPPIYNDYALKIKKVNHLYRRLVLMSKEGSFNNKILSENIIGISDSRSRLFPLGERAIPFYYNGCAKIAKLWNFDDYQKGKPIQFINPIDQSDFFLIEGHLGKESSDIKKRIEDYRNESNRAFNLEIVNSNSLSSFTEKYVEMEHLGGVPKGGTFILVVDDISGSGLVIADLCLPYPIKTLDSQIKEYLEGHDFRQRINWLLCGKFK